MAAVIMRDYRARHTYRQNGTVVSQGPCEVHLDDTFLAVKAGRTLRIGYEQVDGVEGRPDAVELRLFPKGTVVFDGMDGALVRPLFLHLSRLRGKRWAQLLRLGEGDPLDSLECSATVDGGPERATLCELHTNALVGMPLGGEPFELLLADLERVDLGGDYKLVCSTAGRSATLFGCEPTALGRFQRSVTSAQNEVHDAYSTLLSALFPALDFVQVEQMSRLLGGGRLAFKAEIESSVPWLWGRAEEVVAKVSATNDSYRVLRDRAGEMLWFGARELTDDEEKAAAEEGSAPEPAAATDLGTSPSGSPETTVKGPSFVLCFAAGLKADGRRFLVVEFVTQEKGFATYVYRCPEGPSDREAFGATAKMVSEAMRALGFYREPIYASASEIETGRFAELKLAVRKLAYLRDARQAFVGRAFHTSPEAWKSQLDQLLR